MGRGADGRLEGRSLLMGLASGELTVDDFNEKDKKLEIPER